jgi:hypothetical protein
MKNPPNFKAPQHTSERFCSAARTCPKQAPTIATKDKVMKTPERGVFLGKIID